tara:strand:- start:303 stop:1574 length:1272 start_codon:yes stop_codon:yes gene_type:complete
VNKSILYIIILLFISNCSVNKNESIEYENQIEIFKKIEPIQKEFNQNLKIKKFQDFKINPFIKNNSNNNGNIDFDTNFEKISNYKISKLKKFISNQPELFFTDNENIIFFDGKGSVFKLNHDLKEIWKVNNYNKKEKKLSPILYFAQFEKSLIINDNISKLYSINLNDGKVIWSKYNSSSFNSNIKIYKDKFFTVDFDNVIRAISAKDGNELWNFKTDNSFIKSQKKLSIILKDEIVFFINNVGDVTALDVNNGSLVWQTPTQSNLIYQDAFTLENSDLVFENDTIYFSNNKNEFFSIDARTGIIKWTQSINSNLRPTIIDNLIFTISNEGYLFIIDDRTGNILRITDILNNFKNRENIKPIGFIHGRHKIFVSLNNGQIISLNSTTGEQQKITKVHGSKVSRPYIFKNSMYLIKDNAVSKIN